MPPTVVETHSAWVILLGDRAYKVRRPVRLDFLDFSTRAGRERAAHREVELNRRLAPDVYLGVADVLGPDGVVCDHIVVMRRLPDDRRLSVLVQSGTAPEDEIRAIARTVAAFHAHAATSPTIAAVGAPDAIAAKVARDLDEMRVFADELLDPAVLTEVGSLFQRYLTGRVPLLNARVARGHIRDGHGDLLADDIFCLPDGPRILDCLDFDDGLRYGDVLADVAFLAMDLERLGAPRLAAQFLDAYREFTDEHHPATLAHFYIAFRALIRAKVACIRATQHEPTAAPQGARLLDLALGHLREGRVRLVLVGGPPGAGKSTLAAALADHLGWAVLRSDEVRKDISGLGHAEHAEAPLDESIYDAPTTTATYGALLDRARVALGMGEPVVLDASWADSRRREAAAQVARETASELVAFRCDTPPQVADRRIAARRARGDDASDATTGVAAAMRARFEAWPSARQIDTDSEPADALCAALRWLTTAHDAD
jgi:uncharacterized protein